MPVEANDRRNIHPRFQAGAVAANARRLEVVKTLAAEIGVEPAQVAELEDAFAIGSTVGDRYPPGAPAVPGRAQTAV